MNRSSTLYLNTRSHIRQGQSQDHFWEKGVYTVCVSCEHVLVHVTAYIARQYTGPQSIAS